MGKKHDSQYANFGWLHLFQLLIFITYVCCLLASLVISFIKFYNFSDFVVYNSLFFRGDSENIYPPKSYHKGDK